MLASHKYRYEKVSVALYGPPKKLEYLRVEWAIPDESYSPLPLSTTTIRLALQPRKSLF